MPGVEDKGPESSASGQTPEGSPSIQDDSVGPIGPFPTWKSLYATVVVFGIGLILVLLALTRALDPGTP
jgi:hypothetical protein